METVNLKQRVMAAVHSQRGRNFLVFTAFLALSTLLWFVMTLNDEEQCDVRVPIELSGVPDSVTLINLPPASVAVSLRTHGSQRLKMALTGPEPIEIDFRAYRSGGCVKLTSSDLKSLARQALDGAAIVYVDPDTLSLAFTSDPGTRLPVVVDYSITADPRAAIVGAPRASVDSVTLFTADRLSVTTRRLKTQPLVLNGLSETVRRRVAVAVPAGTRAVPDSVDVTVRVEPLILKDRSVAIEAENVPEGMRLITFPAMAKVYYLIAQSDYKNAEPRIRVVADYASIDPVRPSKKIRLRITYASPFLQNVYLDADSAEYVIERQ